MWIRSKEYWLDVIHPVSVAQAIESFIRWITFGIYKPFITATLCGLWEEYNETKEFNRSRRDSGSMR